MRRRAVLLAAPSLLAFCNRSEPPRAASVTVPPPVVSAAPSAAPSETAAPTPRWRPFAFVRGEPEATLGDYAVQAWGPNGASVFASAASVRTGDVAGGPGDEKLIELGRYAVVVVPERGGYFVRDFGERGWVNGLEARAVTGGAKKELVVRYSVRDPEETAKEDWARWQRTPAKVPEIDAVAHMVIEVWSFAGREPAMLFVHEYEGWALCCGSEIGPAPPRVSDDVELGAGEITVRVREAWRANRVSWRETPLPDVPMVLAPWEGVKARRFGFDAARGTFVER